MTESKLTTLRVRPLDGPTRYTHPDVQYFNYRTGLSKARELAMEKARASVSTFIVERYDSVKGWYTVDEYVNINPSKMRTKTTNLPTIRLGSRKLMLD